MQLGGTPPQLFDQAKDGVADIVWTLPTYQAGRFLKSEVFELPFMAKNAETGSPALWEYVQKNAMDEFKGVKVLALHLHDGSLLHFSNKRVTNMDELKGLKVRAPTRIGTKFLTSIGAVPVQMPVPQVTESLAEGGDRRRDGAVGGRAARSSCRRSPSTTSTRPPGVPKMSNSIFVIAMNPAKYDSLPPDLKKVIDANTRARVVEADRQDLRRHDGSGQEARARGERRLRHPVAGRVRPLAQGDRGVDKEWIGEVGAKGGNGAALLDDAKALIKKNGG